MSEPVLTAEWQLAGSWINLGAPRRATTDRGKDKASGKIKAGTMVLTMPNQSRQLDPEHNPVVEFMRPGVLIRLRATWGGITYDLFRGYLERLTQHFGDPDKPNDATAVLECVDGVGLLAGAELESAFAIVMRTQTPRSWYRLNEHRGTVAYDRAGEAHGGYGGFPQMGVTGLLSGDPDTAVEFTIADGGYLVLPPGFVPISPSWSIRFTLQLSALPTVAQNLLKDTRHPFGGLNVWVDTAGVLQVNVTNSSGTVVASAAGSGGGIGIAPQSVSYTIIGEPGQPIRIYNGNVAWTGATTGTSPALSPGYIGIGPMTGADVTLDELVSFDVALTSTQRSAIIDGIGGWDGDYTFERVGKVLDAMSWDAALRDITIDDIGPLRTFEPSSALEHLLAIEQTIQGRLFVSVNGTLVLLSSKEHLAAPYDVSAGTFSDVPGGLPYREAGAYSQGWDDVVNVVRRLSGGDSIEAWDASSVASYGPRVAEVESLFFFLEDEYDKAQWQIAHYADPVPHVDGLVIEPRKTDALWPIALGLDLGRRVTFRRTPQGVGSPLIKDTIIEGIKHDIGPKHWRTTYQVDATMAQRYFQFDVTTWDSEGWRFAA